MKRQFTVLVITGFVSAATYANIIYDSGDTIKKSTRAANQHKVNSVIAELTFDYDKVNCQQYDTSGPNFRIKCFGGSSQDIGGLIFDSRDTIRKRGPANSKANNRKVKSIERKLAKNFDRVSCLKYAQTGKKMGVKCFGFRKN